MGHRRGQNKKIEKNGILKNLQSQNNKQIILLTILVDGIIMQLR